MDVRDAMVKTLYTLMFEWIICKINVTLEKNAGSSSARNAKDSIVGLLDIFGFETGLNSQLTLLDSDGFEIYVDSSSPAPGEGDPQGDPYLDYVVQADGI